MNKNLRIRVGMMLLKDIGALPAIDIDGPISDDDIFECEARAHGASRMSNGGEKFIAQLAAHFLNDGATDVRLGLGLKLPDEKRRALSPLIAALVAGDEAAVAAWAGIPHAHADEDNLLLAHAKRMVGGSNA